MAQLCFHLKMRCTRIKVALEQRIFVLREVGDSDSNGGGRPEINSINRETFMHRHNRKQLILGIPYSLLSVLSVVTAHIHVEFTRLFLDISCKSCKYFSLLVFSSITTNIMTCWATNVAALHLNQNPDAYTLRKQKSLVNGFKKNKIRNNKLLHRKLGRFRFDIN